MKFFKRLTKTLKARTSTNVSARDYPNEEALKNALKDKKTPKNKKIARPTYPSQTDSESDLSVSSASAAPATVEWKLSTFDKAETEPQTMEQELKRLQNLQDYFILDSAAEAEFDCITRLASMTYDTPIALVSLVDLGRQWFMSKVGLDADETPRELAFCAHVVVNKYNILVVPDASKDFRFENNPLVKDEDGLKIRFYAGAALTSPEGYKLGSLCVISPTARPQGLSEKEQRMLHEMAGMVINTMVARRNRLVKEQTDLKMKQAGETLVQVSNALEKVQEQVLSPKADQNLVSMTLSVQNQVCRATARTILEGDLKATKDITGDNVFTADEMDDMEAKLDDILEPKTNLKALVCNLESVLKSFPHESPIVLEMDEKCPTTVVAEDLLLFRSSLNLITNSVQRTNNGDSKNGIGQVRFRVSCDNDELVFEVQDSADVVSEKAVQRAFGGQDSLLGPMATMVRTMGGTCGLRLSNGTQAEKSTCVFWFRVPLELPEAFVVYSMHDDDSSRRNRITDGEGLSIVMDPKPSKLSAQATQVVEDPFQKALIQSGCLSY